MVIPGWEIWLGLHPPKRHVLSCSCFQYLSVSFNCYRNAWIYWTCCPIHPGLARVMKVNSDPWPFYLRSFGFKACHPWEYRNSGPCILKFTEHRWKRCSSYVLLCDGHLTSPSWDENPHVSHVLLVWTCLHFETIHRMRTSALLMVTWYRTSTTSGRHRRRDSCYGAGWKDNMPCNGHSSDPGQCSVTDEVWSLMQVDSHCSYPPDGSCWGSR